MRGGEGMAPWLADLAALEWARVNAFEAPDDGSLTAAKRAEIDPATWPELRLVPVRSLEIMSAGWPVYRVWAQESEESPEHLEPAATSIRVWRRADFDVLHAPMDDREAGAIH